MSEKKIETNSCMTLLVTATKERSWPCKWKGFK